MGQKFFISFNSADRTKAHWIAWTLKEAGHEVAVHDWEIPAGGNAPLWMNTKLAWADRLIAVISPDYVPSRYSPMEWASQIWNDPEGKKGSVIPIIVKPTPKMPPLLRGLSRIDLTNCSEDEARRRLIKGVDMPAPPERKPAFEQIEGEPPDTQHAGPDDKPTFVPFLSPKNYGEILNKLASFAFCETYFITLLLRANPRFDAFFTTIESWGPVGKVVGIIPHHEVLNLSGIVVAFVVAILTHTYQFHDRISDIFGIRSRFDRKSILIPLAHRVGSVVTKDKEAKIAQRRDELMHAVFYKYASSRDEHPLVDKHDIEHALNAWSWLWVFIEGVFYFW
jgi:hypothetical protein